MSQIDFEKEIAKRVEFIRNCVKEANADGIIYGNSGGKDSALVGILCKKACDNVLAVIMPCQSKRNYGEDAEDGKAVAEQFGIECMTVDLTAVKEAMTSTISKSVEISDMGSANIAPRLRMTTLYSIAQSKNMIVSGTGNLSELTMGYFTKWGDGGCDFNPIADLTANEIFEYLKYLDAPKHIIEKPPSAGLFEGQTDEKEMGLTYKDLDKFIRTGEGETETVEKIKRVNKATEHKRQLPKFYQG